MLGGIFTINFLYFEVQDWVAKSGCGYFEYANNFASAMSQKVVGFEVLWNLYVNDDDFKKVWLAFRAKAKLDNFHIFNGYPFEGNHPCIAQVYLREKLIRDLHGKDFSGYLGVETTISSTEMCYS